MQDQTMRMDSIPGLLMVIGNPQNEIRKIIPCMIF